MDNEPRQKQKPVTRPALAQQPASDQAGRMSQDEHRRQTEAAQQQ